MSASPTGLNPLSPAFIPQTTASTTLTNPATGPLQPQSEGEPDATDSPTFTSHPSLQSFQVPSTTYIANLPPTALYHLIATAALVFHVPSPRPAPSSDTTQDPDPPRILLLQRSAHDSLPNRWEPPGGAVDDEDASVLAGCARELREEAGLVAARFAGVVRDQGRVFSTSRGRLVCKFEFVVHVEATSEGLPLVKLDANEHQDFVWATEKECLDGRARTTDGREVALFFTRPEQKETVLEAFGLLKGWM